MNIPLHCYDLALSPLEVIILGILHFCFKKDCLMVRELDVSVWGQSSSHGTASGLYEH